MSPRIRKAPTVRQQMEQRSKGDTTKRRVVRPSSALRPLRRILSPLGVIFRPIGRVLGRFVPGYFKNAWQELGQVTWPNRRETWQLTSAVLIFAIVFGALVAVVDLGLSEMFKRVILK